MSLWRYFGFGYMEEVVCNGDDPYIESVVPLWANVGT